MEQLASAAKAFHVKAMDESGAVSKGNPFQGLLKTEGGDYSVFLFSNSESVTEAVSQFLQNANSQERPPELLLDFDFTFITPQLVEVECEIEALLLVLQESEVEAETPQLLGGFKQENNTLEQKHDTPLSEQANSPPSATTKQGEAKSAPEVFPSLFALARSFNTSLTQQGRGQPKTESHENREVEKGHPREETRPPSFSAKATFGERIMPQESRYEREGGGRQGKDQQKEEGGNKQGKEQHKEKGRDQQGSFQDQEDPRQKRFYFEEKKNKVISIGSIQAARGDRVGPQNRVPRVHGSTESGGAPSGGGGGGKMRQSLGSVENIFIRFMALMARILGQAEYEAHELYTKIKERTDSIDVLTLFISKINSEKGAIDWTNNEEMKKLIERARAIGVDIPQGKLKWTEEEKKLLKENIQMRKDSMEKVTQLERTDMQRYLQEASQCHQARSNVLKLLKEVIDNILMNMRP